ncbi:hypothetical protein KI387_042643, partial [Taxus chinensis]
MASSGTPNLFERTDLEIAKLQSILENPTTVGQYKAHCERILVDLRRIETSLKTYNPFDSESIKKFMDSLKSSVSGDVGYNEITSRLSDKEVVKRSCWSFYADKRKIRAYYVNKCSCPLCAPLIYPRFVASQGQFPNNDQLPLYFIMMLHAEVHLNLKVNYLDIPSYLGQGRGRISHRQAYRKEGAPAVVDARQLVPRPQPFLSGFQDVAAPVVMTAHEGAIEGLAGIARETQLISSDRVGQYLQRRDTSSGGASSTSDARSEVYARASLISPDDFELVTDPAQARRLGRIMAADLLRAYEVIARHCSIPLSGVLDFIEQSGSVSSSQGTTAAATDRLPVAGIVTPDVQHISVPASAPVCGASQPTPSTRVTYTQLLTEHNMDLDVPGLSQLGLVGDIFAGVEVVDDNPIHLETRSAEGSTGQRSTGSVDTPNIHTGTDTEGAAERSEGSGTRPSARRRLQ